MGSCHIKLCFLKDYANNSVEKAILLSPSRLLRIMEYSWTNYIRQRLFGNALGRDRRIYYSSILLLATLLFKL